MKRIILLILMIVGMNYLPSMAQEVVRKDSDAAVRKALTSDEKRQRHEQYYNRILGGDSLKALQVMKVMEEYKVDLHRMMGDQTQSLEAKKQRMEVLISNKNRKLLELLSPEQQSKLIPSTEQTGGRGLKKETPQRP